MALTTIATPQKISPAYNPFYFIVDSDNKTEDNFNYIFDVYESVGNVLGERLIRVRIPQQPIDGYGSYNPMKILQTQIENTFLPNLTGCGSQDYVEYSVAVGESYTYDWDFSGTTGIPLTGSTFLLNVELTSAQTHYYNIGDRININSCAHTPYNGNWEIIDTPDNTSVVLNLEVSTLSSFTGSTKLFNDEATVFSGMTIFTGFTVNNAAIDTYDYVDYRDINFVRTNYYPTATGTTYWYTNAPDNYKIRRENKATMTFFKSVYTGSAFPQADRLKVLTDDGGEFLISMPCVGNVNQAGVGCWNLNNAPSGDVTIISGSLPIIKDTTNSYSVGLVSQAYTFITLTYTFGMVVYLPTVYSSAVNPYNGKNYWTWVASGNTFFLWYNIGVNRWYVSSALGGGSLYLVSTTSGTGLNPPLGNYGSIWVDSTTPFFTNFSSSNLVVTPDLITPFTFEIYDYCGKWDSFEILFMDRKACFMPLNFELVQRKQVSATQKTFKRSLGAEYKYQDRGTTVVQNDLNYRYTIVSNWFTEEQSTYFEELLTSSEIYWNYKGNGNFIPIILTKTAEEIKDKKNSRLIQYTLEFTLANNPMSN